MIKNYLCCCLLFGPPPLPCFTPLTFWGLAGGAGGEFSFFESEDFEADIWTLLGILEDLASTFADAFSSRISPVSDIDYRGL